MPLTRNFILKLPGEKYSTERSQEEGEARTKEKKPEGEKSVAKGTKVVALLSRYRLECSRNPELFSSLRKISFCILAGGTFNPGIREEERRAMAPATIALITNARNWVLFRKLPAVSIPG